MGKLHNNNLKLGMCLIRPNLDFKKKKKDFIYRHSFVKLRLFVNLLYFLNRINTIKIPVLLGPYA